MSYSTLSKRRISKTPGGKLVYLYQKKAAKIPRCGDTGVKLQGIKPARPTALKNMPKTQARVTCLRRQLVRSCCARKNYPRLLDRRAEDCRPRFEGATGRREGSRFR